MNLFGSRTDSEVSGENVPEIIYNARCPICRREIERYKARLEAEGVDMQFSDFGEADLEALGLTRGQAARRFYVRKDGELHGGVDGLRIVWARTRGYKWLASASGWPVIQPLMRFGYDRILAPVVFQLTGRRRI